MLCFLLKSYKNILICSYLDNIQVTLSDSSINGLYSYNVFCHVLQAGTEDGYINLFQIVDDSIMYEKILDKQEGEFLKIPFS